MLNRKHTTLWRITEFERVARLSLLLLLLLLLLFVVCCLSLAAVLWLTFCYYSLVADLEKCKEGLKDKLGAVLFQLPPRAAYTPERLQKILDNINPEFPQTDLQRLILIEILPVNLRLWECRLKNRLLIEKLIMISINCKRNIQCYFKN